MKLTAFLLVAPALLTAALPATTDVLSEINRREASPVAEAEPIYYIKRAGYKPEPEKRDAEAEPIFYIKRTGYKPEPEKRDAEAEPIYYIKRTGYLPEPDKREAEAEVAQ